MWFEIPPRAYGGIEWLSYWLVEGLVARGHEVTLLAAGANHTSARFVQTLSEPPSARLGESFPEVLHAARVDIALEKLDIDVVHDHSFAGPLTSRGRAVPTVMTAHGPVDGEMADFYTAIGPRVSLVAISQAQVRLAPQLPWAAVVHNGIPIDEYPFAEEKEDFLLFLGRMNPTKGVHLAIDAARAAGRRLVIAGKCTEPGEQAYFDAEIAPRLGDDIDWIGQAGPERKKDLLARARCLIFPIQWNEPFGIVMVEAMACGTPVVALDGGSVSEVVIDGVTGYICRRPSELPDAVEACGDIEPAKCRQHAAEMFDVGAMVEGYEAVYRRVVEQSVRGLSSLTA